MSQAYDCDRSRRLVRVASLLALATVLVWSYASTLAEFAERWNSDPQYAHGYLVPVFAAALMWLWREELALADSSGDWWGLAIVGGAAAIRLCGAYFHLVWLDAISLLPSLAGLCLLLCGWRVLRVAWPAIAFLFFMIPLPHRLATSLSGPLQTIAAEGSAFLLQALGRPAIADGNVIRLNQIDLDVVEACSGLRMLMVFFALSTACALLIRKPLWEKLVVCASAVPIALAANIARITATGLLREGDFGESADAFFHDASGWLMMPLALLLLLAEMKLLSHLLIAPPQTFETHAYSVEVGRAF